MPIEPRFHFIRTNGIRLHVAEIGPADGPLLLLLHGFPEFWYGWRNQLIPLASAGFRVVAPDMRGYNLSDKPAGVAAYDMNLIAADIVGLIDALGGRAASVVGHDWGSVIGWWLVTRHVDRIEKFVAINAGHLLVWREAQKDDPIQRKKSGYVRLLQIPALPEALAKHDDCKALIRSLRQSKRTDAFTDADLERYRQAWKQPGAMTAIMNWYRAAVRHKHTPMPAPRSISTPTLVLWGDKDAYGVTTLAERSAALCENVRIHHFPDATHWLPHDEPQTVNQMCIEFLSSTTR